METKIRFQLLEDIYLVNDEQENYSEDEKEIEKILKKVVDGENEKE